MAQVIEATITRFDENYFNRVRSKLNDDYQTWCRTCGKPFEYGDIIHNDYGANKRRVTRHVFCATLCRVISVSEGKKLANPNLEINWQEIKLHIDERMSKRKILANVMFWTFAVAFTAAASSSILLF